MSGAVLGIEPGRSLRELNTLGFAQRAAHYAEIADEEALPELLAHARAKRWPVLVLGGGSNVVLTRDVPGLVVRLVGRGVTHAPGTVAGATRVTASAGTSWHELVVDTLADGLDGLENLSLIPGTVGAAPVQNIGAYGVELGERMHSLHAFHRPSEEWRTLSVADCAFGYRDSLFKRRRDEYVITRVTFELGPQHAPLTRYPSLAAELARRGLTHPDARDVSRAVVAVRRARLPDPARVGNAGSFFHNPLVSAARARELARDFPGIVTYPQEDGQVKIAAGWLIERLGFRGHREHGVGVHERQALVLINAGGGDGRALMALVRRIVAAVRSAYGIVLTIEPLVV